LVYTGKADYEPSPGYERKLHAIGPKLAPVWVGEAWRVPRLLSNTFWYAFRAWRRFNLGLWTPDPDSWLADVVLAFEEHYRAHYSEERHIIDQLDAVIQLLTPSRRRGR
jgi:hypothetical protein